MTCSFKNFEKSWVVTKGYFLHQHVHGNLRTHQNSTLWYLLVVLRKEYCILRDVGYVWICFNAIFPKGCCRIVWSFELSQKRVFQDLSNSWCQSLKTRKWTEQLETCGLHGGLVKIWCVLAGKSAGMLLDLEPPVNFHSLVCEFKELPGASWCRDLLKPCPRDIFWGQPSLDLTGAHSEHLRSRIFFREKTHPPMSRDFCSWSKRKTRGRKAIHWNHLHLYFLVWSADFLVAQNQKLG